MVSSLSHGGAQRSSASLTFVFEKLGYDVFVATVLPGVAYDFTGKLFEIHAIKSAIHPSLNRINKLFKFRRFLNQEKFDLIIDNRARVRVLRELVVVKYLYPKTAIYMIRNFNFEKVFTPYKSFNRWLYKNRRLVSVSESAAKKAKFELKLRHVEGIPNAIPNLRDYPFLSNQLPELPEKYILCCGRIEDASKNLRLLLSAFKMSELQNDNISLVILGSGPDETMIKQYAEALGVDNSIIWLPFMSNPFTVMANALFVTLTSRYEGFPRVLIESLSVGTPVVSVDCESGPSEVVLNEKNGLLVKNNDPSVFADAMKRLIFDQELYHQCQLNAKKSVEHLSIDNIALRWKTYLKFEL